MKYKVGDKVLVRGVVVQESDSGRANALIRVVESPKPHSHEVWVGYGQIFSKAPDTDANGLYDSPKKAKLTITYEVEE